MREAVAMRVDLDDVYARPEINNRSLEESDDDLKALADSIESTDGLLQPIGICKTPEEREAGEHDCPYELVYGFRRYAALRYLADKYEDDKWTKNVQAMLKEATSSQQRHIDQLTENLMRKDLHPIEIGLAFVKALDDPNNPDFKMKDLAAMISWSPSNVSQYVKVARNASPNVHQMCLDGKISFSHVKKIVEYDLPHDQQDKVAAIGEGKSFGDFEAFMDSTYRKSDPKSDEATKETTEPSTPQRLKQAITARQLEDKYLPFIKDKAEKAVGKDKKFWEDAVDALQFVLKIDGTKLGAELAPWEEELAEKQAQEKSIKEEERLRKKAVSTYCKLIDETLAIEPPIDAVERRKFNLNDAYAKVKEQIVADLSKAQAEGLEPGRSMYGYHIMKTDKPFDDKSVDDFVQEISIAWRDAMNEKEERKKKAEQRKKEKAEAEKEGREYVDPDSVAEGAEGELVSASASV
jgi:ParB/RepB/Spo0J family partition protein